MIDVLKELERLEVPYEFAGDGEVKIRCPFHADITPSCSVSVSKALFNCFGCTAAGSFSELYGKLIGKSTGAAYAELSKVYKFASGTVVDFERNNKWVDNFTNPSPRVTAFREQLARRCVSNDAVKSRQIGCIKGGRYLTIPVYSKDGWITQVRAYDPTGENKPKFKTIAGNTRPQLYPIAQLEYERILICGGEIKALAAIPILNPHNIG